MSAPTAGASPRRALHGLVLALVVLLGAAAAVVLTAAGADQRDGLAAGRDAAAALAAVPPPTAPTTTTTTAPPLPVPEALPVNAHEPTPEVVLGTLELPTLGVSEPLQEGMTLTAINRGPSHWPGTALPGGRGNVVVAGHRTTYSKPFHRLDELQPGDPVVFRMRDGAVHTYVVRGVVVVPEAAIGIAAQFPSHTATLFACHPKGSATHRIVAKLALVGPDGAPVDDEAALPPLDVGLREGDDLLVVRDPTGPAPVTDPLAATDVVVAVAPGEPAAAGDGGLVGQP